ncbi:MAG: AbrB/MazE/SpoVT family DNA-binding domain-containing protein [Ilumatobacteraceae bacterium]
MRVTAKGQVTIPKQLRDALGLVPGTEVDVEQDGATIIVRKTTTASGHGRELVERLRGRGDVPMTTDEILALTRGS